MRGGKVERALRPYPIAQLGAGNVKKATKGRTNAQTVPPREATAPPVGGVGLWGVRAPEMGCFSELGIGHTLWVCNGERALKKHCNGKQRKNKLVDRVWLKYRSQVCIIALAMGMGTSIGELRGIMWQISFHIFVSHFRSC